uniref:DNA_pol_B_exo1 domain-containing protein n=1 Tax=Macrostomum lignano TaxID=282301 RepID=A0A1I8HZA0_9PLAT
SQSPVLSSRLAVADEAAADTDAVTGKSALEKLRSAFACSKSRSTGAATEYAPVAKSPLTKSYSARSPPRKRQKSLAAFWSPASMRPVAGDEVVQARHPQMVTVEKPDSNDEADDEAAIQPEEDFVYDDCPEFGGCNDPALTAAARPRIVCPFRPDRLLQLYETDADCRTDDSAHARFRARIRPEESAAAEAELRASLDRDGL